MHCEPPHSLDLTCLRQFLQASNNNHQGLPSTVIHVATHQQQPSCSQGKLPFHPQGEHYLR